MLVLEAADAFWRGGNTRHTRNMRCAHDTATASLSGPYGEEEFLDDLLRVTKGKTDEALARFMIRRSKSMLGWIEEQGVRWQPSLGGTLSLGRTNSFFLGGGRAMLNALYRTAEDLGVAIRYEAEVTDIAIENGRFHSVAVGRRSFRPRRWSRPPAASDQHRLAEALLGRGGREFPDPRHPQQQGHDPAPVARQGRAGNRRPDAVPRRRHRRPRAEIRWRHHHPAGLRGFRHRREPSC